MNTLFLKTLTATLTSFLLVAFSYAGGHDDHSAEKDIVDIAASDENFSTLVTAVTKAELVETLKVDGPFTVFAPTNSAFAKVPSATLNRLLADKKALTDVLTYHVVSGKVLAADVVSLKEAKTVQGQKIKIKVDGDKVYINDAQVIKTDLMAKNGVIHVIDSVILPN